MCDVGEWKQRGVVVVGRKVRGEEETAVVEAEEEEEEALFVRVDMQSERER
jgi:hypothetical protein